MTEPLPVREAYRLWAPTYERENAVTALDGEAVQLITPPLRGRTLLDVGCGTGRRLREARDAALAIGIDLVFDMLAAGAPAGSCLAAADICALPLRGRTFDVIWCRLVLGHVTALQSAYGELRRVAATDAQLIITDFHPAAAAAGHTRSFRDAAGRHHVVEHHVHDVARHNDAAASAGWHSTARVDACVGPTVQHFYDRAGMSHRFDADAGLPLVLALAFRA